MKKKSVFLLCFFIFLIFLTHKAVGDNQVCFEAQCFKVSVVHKAEDLEKGLMFRERLDKQSGMLFIFPDSSAYTFWMKNTLIPLDIIWMDEFKEIVFIAHNALPCLKEPCRVYNPKKDAKYVLEINGGICQKLKIDIGQKAKFLFK